MQSSEANPARVEAPGEIEVISFMEFSGSRAFYRPEGRVSAGQLADLITAAIEQSRMKDVRELLVNIVQMTGFKSPGPAYRRWVARRWAEAAEGALRVVVVARAEHICPRKTGLL